ncbi:MAG: signal peptidase I [Cyanobacteria bacterium P01_A01_bin.37]
MTNRRSTVNREPWLAVLLSTLLPGIGQLYAGQWLRGFIFLCLSMTLLAMGTWLLLDPSILILFSVSAFIGYLTLQLVSLFDAYRCAVNTSTRLFNEQRQGNKDPWLAVFLTRIVPGLGHAYQEQWGAAGTIFFVAALIFILNGVASRLNLALWLIMIVVSTVLTFFFLYHVYMTSPTRRSTSKQLILSICLLLFGFRLLTAGTTLCLQTFVAETHENPASNMLPTLQVGDQLLVDKLAYHVSDIHRGDIILFEPSRELIMGGVNESLIKRVIGLPGETVEVRGGTVYINDEPLVENYIAEPPADEFQKVAVSSGAYFVMGDNRNNSYDSRYWGLLRRSYITGKVTKRLWPLSRMGLLD